MTTVTFQSSVPAKETVTADYHAGQFDAALSLPPQSQTGDYFKGYIAKVNETGNTPF